MNNDKISSRCKQRKVKKIKDTAVWINECDERLSNDMYSVAEDICKDATIKLIRLIGPSCAGKTTAAKMLMKRFEELGKRLHTVSLDDFYFNTDILRKNSFENGLTDIDYDSPNTIDTVALASFVKEIFEKDRSHCPIFDFTVGRRTGYREFQCTEDDIFLFEGIQALYPNVTEIFERINHPSRTVYIAPLSTITVGKISFTPNEIRLLRRIVRDRNFRNSEAIFTYAMWDGVRANEEKNIFPYVKNCDYEIDSTMPYEIGILKPHLEIAFSLIPMDSEYRERSDEILEKISGIVSISDALISEHSIYKEFV